jgi:DNA-binding response OmpR family regulator
MTHILILTAERSRLTETVRVLNDAGYSATGASTFEEAKHFLESHSPDVVIADERLGEFNGLHVILSARAQKPDVGAIVTTPSKTPGLEADARSLNVEYRLTPPNPTDWLRDAELRRHATSTS